MGTSERAKFLDALRKRRARKRARALNEGKPEDFYITPEDSIEFYENTGQQATPVNRVAQPTRTPRAASSAPSEQGLQMKVNSGGDWKILTACGVIIGGALTMPFWLPRLFK